MIPMTGFPLVHIKMNDSRRRGCSQLLEPHWGCLVDKCALFHGLLCFPLLEGTLYWDYKIKRTISECCSPFEILSEVCAGEKLFVLLLKRQNKSCFPGIMTNSQIILGNATSQKAIPTPPPQNKNSAIRLRWNKIYLLYNTTAIINN